MFGNRDTTDDDAQGPAQPSHSTFRMPALITWEIEYRSNKADITKELVVGHGMTLGTDGSITISTFYIDPTFGPTPRPTWGRASYVSFKDVTPPAVIAETETEESLVHLH